MSARDLLNFLLNEQREQVSMEDALRLIEKYEVDETGPLGFSTTSCSFGRLRVCQHAHFVHLPLLSTSEAEEALDQRWLPDVPAPGGGLHPQPGP